MRVRRLCAQDQLAGTERQNYRNDDPQRAAGGRADQGVGERAAKDEREHGTGQTNEPARRVLRRHHGRAIHGKDRQEVPIPPALVCSERNQH